MKSKMQKQEEAKLRVEKISKISSIEKLSNLNLRLGKGIGAKRERIRLQSKLEN